MTGFEELKIKVFSLIQKEENTEDESVYKCADHFLELVD
jgi:hypothetical protein